MINQLGFTIQKILLGFSYQINKVIAISVKRSSYNSINWVLGTQEVASILKNLSSHLDSSVTVKLSDNHFYQNSYDFTIPKPHSKFLKIVVKLFYGPCLLGYLTVHADKFVFVGERGFLINSVDERKYEFAFLKSKKKTIITILTGTDIRSPKKMKFQFLESKEENFGNYQFGHFTAEEFDTFDEMQRERAEIIDNYSDFIFQSEYDQASYLTKQHYPNWFFLSPEIFNSDSSKFKNLETPIILHAPSNPFIKGTQIVRSTIKRLELEGYIFDYVELINERHEVVLNQLSRAHIVINELFGFVPGYFAMEAMAKTCVVVTRADETYEQDLPEGSNSAWVVTPPYMLYDNVKQLLESKTTWEDQAVRGHNWARKYAYAPTSAQRMSYIVERAASRDNTFGDNFEKVLKMDLN